MYKTKEQGKQLTHRKKIFLMMVVLITFICVIAIRPVTSQQFSVKEDKTIKITSKGQILGIVELNKIKDMPQVKRRMTIHSTSGDSTHDFRGTLLSNVLQEVDPKILEEYLFIRPIGVDDYASSISMEEVLKENSVYIMYSDGEELLMNKNGQPGSMRVVVLNDAFGQRFTNYLIEIALE